ncbi:MAG: hypothetical protein HY560_13560, partial [Gemmatimonadetes bacterium]|nr:hypothetical protein [Gemmatimonadota bacterium]
MRCPKWITVWALTLGLQARAAAQSVSTRIVNDPQRGELGILIGPVDLPAGGEHAEHLGGHGMVYPPVQTVTIPVDAYVYGFHYDVIDAEGQPVP